MNTMTSIIDSIIQALDKEAQGNARDETLLQAGDIFERVRGVPTSTMFPEIDNGQFNDAEVAKLKRAVIAFVERKALGSWTLSKCHDYALKPVFVRVLRRQLHGDSNELYQAMIALDNLGENIFQGARSMSVEDEEKNRGLVRTYLDRLPNSP